MTINSSLKKFKIEVSAETSNLLIIREQLSQFLKEINFDDERVLKILLVVDEFITNIIKHSFHEDSSKSIRIEVVSTIDQVTIEIYDDGDVFDVLDYKTSTIEEHIKNPHKGGLGIPFMKLFADSIEYFPKSEKSGTNITIFKFVSN